MVIPMSDEPFLLDEDDELYGYGVYNVRENCFVDIPEINRGITAEDHLAQEEDEHLLNNVAVKHGLDSTDHLRIVRVHLDNELDKLNAQNVEE